MKPEDKVASDVRAHGWHVILVAASDSAPEFAYTVGLTATFGHPEIAVFGLRSTTAHKLLNEAGSAIRNGSVFGAGVRSSELLVGTDVAFIAFPRGEYPRYLGFARQYYGGDGFAALQLMWPDPNGRFPWEAGVAEHARVVQAVAP